MNPSDKQQAQSRSSSSQGSLQYLYHLRRPLASTFQHNIPTTSAASPTDYCVALTYCNNSTAKSTVKRPFSWLRKTLRKEIDNITLPDDMVAAAAADDVITD
ncbi:hypothetical protein FOZ60_006917 [Perkinsus olseni]|uniref:Uncharacterized protein n=1 Tax=Perkinsus olseni TaxID=32597 RepID=A0A7J6PEX3_PEROL|nr:hypothetical protein FOZ60_006917 [Perkinsus olseni]